MGTGALGPFGSAQTVLLAIINVLMQLVFVGIAIFNFTTPEIDQEPTSNGDTICEKRMKTFFGVLQYILCGTKIALKHIFDWSGC